MKKRFILLLSLGLFGCSATWNQEPAESTAAKHSSVCRSDRQGYECRFNQTTAENAETSQSARESRDNGLSASKEHIRKR